MRGRAAEGRHRLDALPRRIQMVAGDGSLAIGDAGHSSHRVVLESAFHVTVRARGADAPTVSVVLEDKPRSQRVDLRDHAVVAVVLVGLRWPSASQDEI